MMQKHGLLFASVALLILLLSGRANAWVRGYQPFPDGEATVVLHRFCQKRHCGTASQHDWQRVIQQAIAAWNAAGANFRFQTRPFRVTDDPCRLPGEVAVILTEPGRLCPGDGPLPRGEISGRTEFRPGGRARIYINDADDFFGLITQQGALVNPIRTYLVHEFGHVVGLGHPDEAGQRVTAIMNSDFGPFDEVSADDIAGIRALYSPAAAGASELESPARGATLSGVGFISGWKCRAQDITVQIDNRPPIAVAMGMPRADTRSSCGGEVNNGFIVQTNWNWFGDGPHTAVAYDQGVEFARTTFTVGSTGEEFLKGVTVSIDVPNFPAPGETGRFVWNESTQHLELAEVVESGAPPVTSAARFDGEWNLDIYAERNCHVAPGSTPQQGTVQVTAGVIFGHAETSGGPFGNVASSHDLRGTVSASGTLRMEFIWTYSSGAEQVDGVFSGTLADRRGSGTFEQEQDGGDPSCTGRWGDAVDSAVTESVGAYGEATHFLSPDIST